MSNVGPQLVRQLVHVAMWPGPATVRSSCACKVRSSPRMHAAVLAAFATGLSVRWRPAHRRLVAKEMNALSRATRGLRAGDPAHPSRCSSPVQGTPGCPSFGGQRTVGQASNGSRLTQSRAQKRGEVCQRAIGNPRQSTRLCGGGPSGYHRQMPTSLSPAWLWPNPSIERTF